MPLILTCQCSSRFIKRFKGEPACCSKCGSLAILDSPEARHSEQLQYDYECPITGIPIRSKRAHEENLKRHGKHVFEKGELEDAKRTRQAIDDELDRKLEETAAAFVGSLSPERKAQLEIELLTTETTIQRN